MNRYLKKIIKILIYVVVLIIAFVALAAYKAKLKQETGAPVVIIWIFPFFAWILYYVMFGLGIGSNKKNEIKLNKKEEESEK